MASGNRKRPWRKASSCTPAPITWDPPYWGCETDYGKNMFERADFASLAELLAGIKGRFLLSINDTPEIRAIFSGFDVEAVETTYTVGGGARARKAGELIFFNS